MLPDLPPLLVQAHAEGRLAIMIGSGLSMAEDVVGDFPSWWGLPKRILTECGDLLVGWSQDRIDHELVGLKYLSTTGELLAKLDLLVEGLGTRYRTALGRIIRPKGSKPGDVHRALLETGVGPLLTTNYDSLIERADSEGRARYTWRQADAALADLQDDRPIIFKVHGCATDADSVVLTRREYDALAAAPGYRAVMEHLFAEYAVLFVGYGMNDPFDLDHLLRGRVDLLKSASRTHFVLIHEDHALGAERWLREFNAHAITYASHAQVPQILRMLSAPSATRATATRPTPATDDALARWCAFQRDTHTQRVLFFEEDGNEAMLDEVYVELHLTRVGGVRGGGLGPHDGKLTLDDLLQRPGRRGEAGRYAVLGEPGAGKSTIARHLTWSRCAPQRDPTTSPVPLYVPLVDWAVAEADPFDWAGGQLTARDAAGVAEGLRGLAGQPGRLWLLLDGFDELAAGDVGPTRHRIERLAARYPHMVIAVFSRPIGYDRIGGFERADLRPLDPERQAALLTNWLDADGTAALAAITEQPSMAEAAGNPLMLSLLAITWWSRVANGEAHAQPMPTTRTELFGAALAILLQRGHHWKRSDAPRIAEPTAIRQLLGQVSLTLTEAGGEAWSRSTVRDALAYAAGQCGLPMQWSDVDACLDDIARHTGILARAGDRWRFMHRALRERLAAERLVEMGPDEVTRRVEAIAEDEDALGRWGETLGIACSLLDQGEQGSPLIALCATNPALTVRVLPQLTGLPPAFALFVLFSIGPGQDQHIWDGDTLVDLARGWPDGRLHLWRLVGDARTLDQLAFLHYALGHPQLAQQPGDPPTAEAFFGRLSRWRDRARPQIETQYIAPGVFVMGSPPDEPERSDDEGPQRRVELTRGFRLGTTPVTIGHYAAFDPEHACLGASPDHPVVEVSWWRARFFAAWVGGRLPTEAEWEYACRAGTPTATYAGSIDILGTNNAPALDPIAWYGGNSGVAEGGVDSSSWPEKQHPHTRASTHPVGSKQPSPWGLHDMLGNVWEWVADWHGDYRAASTTDPPGPPAGASRVFRGGSFGSFARDVRSAFRNWWLPDFRRLYLGFRVALPPENVGPGS